MFRKRQKKATVIEKLTMTALLINSVAALLSAIATLIKALK